jgi:hypothetical protein
VVFVVVSLLTRPMPPEDRDRWERRLRVGSETQPESVPVTTP